MLDVSNYLLGLLICCVQPLGQLQLSKPCVNRMLFISVTTVEMWGKEKACEPPFPLFVNF